MKRFIAAGLVLYCLIAAWGPFISRGMSGIWFFPWAIGFLFLVFSIAYDAYVTPTSASPVKHLPFSFVLLGILLLNFIGQIAGGFPIGLWPGYLLFAVVVSAFSPPGHAYAMAAVIIVIETLSLLMTGQNISDRLPLYAGFSLSLVGVSAAASHIMQRTHRKVTEARQDLDRLVETAEALDPLSSPGQLEALTPTHRQAAHIRTAKQREIDFNGLIEMIYGFVPAHTYALFLRDAGESGPFALRAVRSASAHAVQPVGTVLDPEKRMLVDICADQRQPQYLSDLASMSMPLANLGYYRPDIRELPVRSFLLLPIINDDTTLAVLAVDSLEPGAFSLETQDMLEKFAPFFRQIIENIDMALKLKTRADHFSALHEISTELNKSLWFGDIMRAILPRLRAIVPFDLCACVLITEQEGRQTLTLATLAGYDESFLGRSFPLDESSILTHMLKHWREQGAIKYYSADFGDRGRDIGLFPFRELQHPIRSMYGRLLIAKDTAVGAFFLASLRSNGFTGYQRDFLLDTLMNQVSQVAHNSLLYQRIESMARTDGLTGLLNHRTFMEKLREKYKELARTARPFSVLLTDIDKFKGVNDKYGHPVGDVAIKAVARVLAEAARGSDFPARYGGEEFAVGMVDTDRRGAEQLAERLRKIMEQTVVTRVADGELKVTLSIGVASFPEDTEEPANLVALADEALYHAKRTGRNRVCTYRSVAAAQPTASSS